jgi:hypothetical protein
VVIGTILTTGIDYNFGRVQDASQWKLDSLIMSGASKKW